MCLGGGKGGMGGGVQSVGNWENDDGMHSGEIYYHRLAERRVSHIPRGCRSTVIGTAKLYIEAVWEGVTL